MEYHLFKFLREKIKLPLFIRIFFWILFLIWGLIVVILPIFFSVPTGIFLMILWLILIIHVKKIKHIIKIKKSIIYLCKNITNKETLKKKIKDIKILIYQLKKQKKDKN